jgi:uncharacterized phage protein (TIGR02218 family)
MPLRDISSEFATFLQSGVLTLALCVKVVRRDGVAFTFTSHDRNITLLENLTEIVYLARNSVEVSALRQEAAGSVDNVEITGLLQSDLVTAEDIRAGLFDGAYIEFFVVNYRNLAMGRLVLQTGTLGEVSFETSKFTAEIRSMSQLIAQQVGELISPLCRVKQLGDSRCQVNLEDYQFTRTVAIIDDIYTIRFEVDTHPDDYFTYGRVIAVTGANAGIDREIKQHTNVASTAYVVLQEAFPEAFEVGDEVTLEAGCDRRSVTCINRFDNIINFRGEPHVPGNDRIMKRGRK